MSASAIVLTCYLTQRPDPQRGETWRADCDETVRHWIESARHCRLRGIIFHDGLSDEFIARWSDPAVQFEQIAWQGGAGWSALEERVRIYRDWLKDHKVDWALTTDLNDVEFFHDPFPLMTEPAKIYVGSEPNPIGSTCIAEWMTRAYGLVSYPNRQVLNPGIVGGSRVTLLYFLKRYLRELESVLKRAQPPIDVAAFNRLIYLERIPFVTGPPLHTIFRMHETAESGAAIRHK